MTGSINAQTRKLYHVKTHLAVTSAFRTPAIYNVVATFFDAFKYPLCPIISANVVIFCLEFPVTSLLKKRDKFVPLTSSDWLNPVDY